MVMCVQVYANRRFGLFWIFKKKNASIYDFTLECAGLHWVAARCVKLELLHTQWWQGRNHS